VAAERGRAALGDRLEDAPLLRGQAVEILRMRAHDIGQFPAAGAGRLGTHGGRSLARGGGQAGQIRRAIQRALGSPEMRGSDLRVELRGAQAAVAQEDLDHAQVGAAFEQMGSGGVPERIGIDVLGDPRAPPRALED
jgi:hypothetical protein